MKKNKFIIFVALFFLVNLLVSNDFVSLWDEDEAAYSGFATVMLETGDWVNPEFQYATIHRKTPFHFWSIAAFYQLLGANEFVLRLPSVLAILLTCCFVWLLGAGIFGEKIAKRAAIILASSIFLPLMAKIAFTDATLLCCSTLAVLSLFHYLKNPSWKWNLGLWGGIALGVLVKGPPIVVLLGGIWILLAIAHPNRKRLIGTHPWFFAPLALVPVVYWGYLSYQQDYALWLSTGQDLPFADWWNQSFKGRKIYLLPFLWDWYVLRRISGAVLGQSGFWGYHLVVLTVAFLTWLPFWFSTLVGLFKSFRKPNPTQILLLSWLLISWFFWELMSSKLPSYSMAAQPALAILMAFQIEKIEAEKNWNFSQKLGLGLYVFIFSILIIGIPIAAVILFAESKTLYYTLPMSLILTGLLWRVFQSRKDTFVLFQNLAIFGLSFMFLLWVAVAPLIENSPIKAYDDVVNTAYQMSGNDAKARFVLTGLNNKQLKISLFVYGKQRFGKIEELYNPEAMAAYQSDQNTVLVIGCDQLAAFEASFKAQNLVFEPKEIVCWSTDDQLKEHNFYLVANHKLAK